MAAEAMRLVEAQEAQLSTGDPAGQHAPSLSNQIGSAIHACGLKAADLQRRLDARGRGTVPAVELAQSLQELINEHKQAQAAPADQQAMVKMQKLVPIITELAGGKMQEYGLPNVMMGVMQIQMVAGQDPVVAEGVGLLTKCSMGQVPDDATVAAYLAKLG